MRSISRVAEANLCRFILTYSLSYGGVAEGRRALLLHNLRAELSREGVSFFSTSLDNRRFSTIVQMESIPSLPGKRSRLKLVLLPGGGPAARLTDQN